MPLWNETAHVGDEKCKISFQAGDERLAEALLLLPTAELAKVAKRFSLYTGIADLLPFLFLFLPRSCPLL